MNKVTLSIGMAFGATAGFALAYLFAPQSGRQLEEKMKLEGMKLKREAILKADDFITDLNYKIDREVSKEEARRLNDMRERMSDTNTYSSYGAEYAQEAVIEVDEDRLDI